MKAMAVDAELYGGLRTALGSAATILAPIRARIVAPKRLGGERLLWRVFGRGAPAPEPAFTKASGTRRLPARTELYILSCCAGVGQCVTIRCLCRCPRRGRLNPASRGVEAHDLHGGDHFAVKRIYGVFMRRVFLAAVLFQLATLAEAKEVRAL